MTKLTVLYHRASAALPERAGTALLRNRLITRLASVAMVTTPDPGLRRWIHAEHDRYFSTFADRRTLLEAFGASIGHDVTEFALFPSPHGESAFGSAVRHRFSVWPCVAS